MKNKMQLKELKKRKIKDSKLEEMSLDKKTTLIENRTKAKADSSDMWVTIGEKLRARREKLGYRASDVAEIMDLSERTVTNHETADSTPSYETLLEYCAIYDCSIGYLRGEYKEATQDLHFICTETGLSEEAVNYLLRNDPYTKSTATMISFLIEEEIKSEEKSLIGEMLSYFLDEVNMFWISKNKWFPLFDRIFNRVAPNFEEEQHYVSFDDYYQDTVESFAFALRECNYSETEIDEIRHSVEQLFRAYYLRLEYRKLNQVRLQSKIIKSMDTMVSINAKNQEERR